MHWYSSASSIKARGGHRLGRPAGRAALLAGIVDRRRTGYWSLSRQAQGELAEDSAEPDTTIVAPTRRTLLGQLLLQFRGTD